MISHELERAIVFSAPLVSALVCLALAALDARRSDHPVRRRMCRRTIVTYGIVMLVWTGFILHSISHTAFMYSLPLFAPLIMACEVLIYRAIRTMTDSGERRAFSPWAHFAAPALMFVTMLIVVLTIPAGRLTEIVYGTRGGFAKYAVTAICLAYSIVYPVIGLVEIWRYRRKVAETTVTAGGTHIKALDRLFRALLVELVVLPVPALGLLLGIAPFRGGGFVWTIAVLPTIVTYIISCCNLLSDNYMIIEADTSSGKSAPQDNVPRLGRERVEQYLANKKPYLNPAYRITDMAEDLFTNRAYISAFINTEYKMNFSRFVNGYRLREVEKLRGEAARKKQHVPSLQLILNAGFSNYRGYLRAKKELADAGESTPSAE